MPITIKTKTKTQSSIVTNAEPLQTLDMGAWLKGPTLTALRTKYGLDRDAGQRGADFVVRTGMVRIPEGCTLKAVTMRRWGGVLGFVVEPIGASKAKASIEGLPD